MTKRKTIYFPGWGAIPITLEDTAVKNVFTCGECGALSKALNYITGCKMIRTDNHVAVITFDGQVLDIKGLHTPSTFEDEWGETYPIYCDRDLELCGVSNWRKALPFAKLLAERYIR